MKVSRILIIIALGLAMNISAQSQENDLFTSDLSSILKTIPAIKNQWKLDKDVRAQATSIVSNTEMLQKLYRRNGGKGVSDLYRSTLLPYISVLNEYANKKGKSADAKLTNAILELNEELRIKILFSQSMKGGGFADIEVVVDTKKSGEPISGYEVWYVPKGWRGNEEHYERFDNLSTPAVKQLPPGNYFIWTKKGGYQSDYSPFSFGFDEQTKRRIDLEVL